MSSVQLLSACESVEELPESLNISLSILAQSQWFRSVSHNQFAADGGRCNKYIVLNVTDWDREHETQARRRWGSAGEVRLRGGLFTSHHDLCAAVVRRPFLIIILFVEKSWRFCSCCSPPHLEITIWSCSYGCLLAQKVCVNSRSSNNLPLHNFLQIRRAWPL